MSDPADVVRRAATRPGLVTVLTGAGISAASGIPTFRGPEGYWTVGTREYTQQELATRVMFERTPDEVWAWYLYRLGVCRAADPNPAHDALATLERGLGDRFLLITQNVDGLHRRAGNSPTRTYAVHGEIEWARCSAECTLQRVPLPDAVTPKRRGEPLTDADRAALRCARLRPHVLWFDETTTSPASASTARCGRPPRPRCADGRHLWRDHLAGPRNPACGGDRRDADRRQPRRDTLRTARRAHRRCGRPQPRD